MARIARLKVGGEPEALIAPEADKLAEGRKYLKSEIRKLKKILKT